MAQVQFVWKAKDIRRTTGLPAPKRVEQPEAWLNQARKRIKEIPKMGGVEQWVIFSWSADLDYIVFNLRNNKDEKCDVVIDRKRSAIGAN